MKSSKIWSMMMLMVIALTMMVSCGGENETDGGDKNIDGVNVVSGKRMTELNLYESKDDSEPSSVYKMEYDSKGRLTKLLVEQWESSMYGSGNGKYRSGKYTDLATIDYELRVITIYFNTTSSSKMMFGFSLNKDGFISQIGECSFNYDTNGYLIGVENPKGIGTLVYDNNELVKAMTSHFSNGRTSLYYITYGNVNDKGELYTLVKRTNTDRTSTPFKNFESVIGFIAYQSGLFGKVVKVVYNLKDKNDATQLFKYSSDNYNSYKGDYEWNGKMTFVLQ